MEIQSLDSGKVVIHLSGTELQDLRSAPETITTDEVSDILRLALGSTYDTSWESVFYELYLGKDSLLLFALRHSGNPAFFAFEDSEPLIQAALVCPPGMISYLAHMGGAYILVVYPWAGEDPPCVLYEYGRQLCHPPHFSLHLSEQGNLIDGPCALDRLRAAFI